MAGKPKSGSQLEPIRAYDPYRPRRFSPIADQDADARASLESKLSLVGDMLDADHRAKTMQEAGRMAERLAATAQPKKRKRK
jgi:hypothetical protein